MFQHWTFCAINKYFFLNYGWIYGLRLTRPSGNLIAYTVTRGNIDRYTLLVKSSKSSFINGTFSKHDWCLSFLHL